MGRFVISWAFGLLTVCLYLATNQVGGQTTDDSPCPWEMQAGDVKHFGCNRCTCTEDGLECKGCPPHDPVPANCQATSKEGQYPICCEQDIVCT